MERREERPDGGVLQAWWAYADQSRRLRGTLMEAFGFGPDSTPSRVVRTSSTARLRAYQAPRPERPALLLVPAPIKSGFIWDLAPEVSVVRRCLAAGMQVYLIEWQAPEAGDERLGLADYAGGLILDCLDAVSEETKQPDAFLAGHSLGGTLAAIFSSLHANRVRGLIELEGPMHFPEAGSLESAARAMPPPARATRGLANVPGSFLSVAAAWADPVAFEWEPWLDWSRSQASSAARRRYWQVNRWALDETPMPKRLFEEVVKWLYREDRFARRALCVGGRPADPRAITAPVLAVADPRSRVVPPASMRAYRDLTASGDVDVLEYPGDVGVMLQHVGVLVGEQAHEIVWPRILAWVRRRSGASRA